MRWHIIGGRGMLGSEFARYLEGKGDSVQIFDRPQIDITSESSLCENLSEADVIVNTAAFTAVDAAEQDEATAFAVNAVGAANVARYCAEHGVRLVHISTDYVFPGNGSLPYSENSALEPVGAYGRTKAAGEWGVQAYCDDFLIVRTAWLYGAYGNCFPKTMAKLSDKNESLSVVTDEVGQPTWTWDLVDLIVHLIKINAPSGIYHGTSSGETNWYNFAREIIAAYGKDPSMIHETTAAAFNRPAPRPHYSALAHSEIEALGIDPIGDWRERWKIAAPFVLESL